MVKLTKQNGEEFYLNIDLIEIIKEVPHTVIITVNEDKYLVQESAEEIIQRIVKFRRKTYYDKDLVVKGDS
ncbi:MAG: flagellar FlbD family protein [Bacillota bacterium]|nr:flagellar FlbD family protein [Bacillota bacterium]